MPQKVHQRMHPRQRQLTSHDTCLHGAWSRLAVISHEEAAWFPAFQFSLTLLQS